MFNWCKRNHNVLETKVNYSEAINVWHDPILNIGDFVEYKHNPTSKTYFLFVIDLTPSLIRFGCGETEFLYKIHGKTNGYDLVNSFIESKGIKKLF